MVPRQPTLRRHGTATRFGWLRWYVCLHADQSGSISIASVFAVLCLAFLLGMVMNSSLQVDQKVKMQNAADAATHSGAVVLARSMNTLAFTNHLLCDTFALTAFMRAAHSRQAESLSPSILDNWERIGPALAGSEFPKFADLGVAIGDKVRHERELVRRFSDWAAAASELMLPVLEETLAQQRITEFQRAVVRTTPQTAQAATDEVARRHGQAWPRRTALQGCLWRTDGTAVAASDVDQSRLLPVVDPMADAVAGWQRYVDDARRQRFELAHGYLRAWDKESMELFDGYVKMSQFGSLWRTFTGGHLQKLLHVDYPDTNLPFQILTPPEDSVDRNDYLEYHHMVIGVVYRTKMSDRIPGMFRNPVAPDTMAYAQAMVFVPRQRSINLRDRWYRPITGEGSDGAAGCAGCAGCAHCRGDGACTGCAGCPDCDGSDEPEEPEEPEEAEELEEVPPNTGIPGQKLELGLAPSEDAMRLSRVMLPGGKTTAFDEDQRQAGPVCGTVGSDSETWFVMQRERTGRVTYDPRLWSLINQNWTVQLAPATSEWIPGILSSPPYGIEPSLFQVPALGGMSSEEFQWVSNH